MTLKEALATNKKITRKEWGEGHFGKITEEKGKFIFREEGDSKGVTLKLTDIFADDWKTERVARTFYLGMLYVQSHDKKVKVLRALEGENAPEDKTADGEPWVRVVEILEPEQE